MNSKMKQSDSKTLPPEQLLISRNQSRAVLGVGLTTLDSLIKLKHLTTVHVGRRVLITLDSLRAVARQKRLSTRRQAAPAKNGRQNAG